MADTAGWGSKFSLDWAYDGVDPTLPGNGGVECRDFLPVWQRVAESALACVFSVICLYIASTRLKLPEKIPPIEKSDHCGKRILLVVMCLTFGIEIGFKFATRQLIWILNPCHVATMMQIYLLAAPPSRTVTTVFRLNLHMLSGAPIAILFPVINTRLLPFETEVYYIQHVLMLIIPFYLMKIGGVYTPEPVGDFSWAYLSLGWLYSFHFVPLQYLAYLSQVNLNNMLCPAVSDPFYGRCYRLVAMTHQVLCLPIIGKTCVAIANWTGLRNSNPVPETHVFWRGEHSKSAGNSSLKEESKTVSTHQEEGMSEEILKDKDIEDADLKLRQVAGKNGYINGAHHSNHSNGHLKRA